MLEGDSDVEQNNGGQEWWGEVVIFSGKDGEGFIEKVAIQLTRRRRK